MSKLIFFHGTSEKNARQIEKHGFKSDCQYNWKIKGKKGFVYLSTAYAPFYAMCADKEGNGLALIKVEVDENHLFPEDDFLMTALGKPKYTQKELDQIKLKDYKKYWKESVQHMGNVAVKPQNIKILGIRYFNGKGLLWFCDPVISPINYKVCGEYYKKLSEWIYAGKDFKEMGGMEIGQT